MLLVVNADDVGYAERRDDGIFRTLQQNAGIVTSVSLMVNGQSAVSAGKRLVAMENRVDVGLHVNLTEGTPTAPSHHVPTLLEGGYFLGKMGFRTALREGKISLDQVRQEIAAQFEKFHRLLGYHPHHADGHQHIHVLPGVRDVFASELHKHSVHWTRLPIEPHITHACWVSTARRQFYQQITDDARQSLAVFASHGIASTRHFVGMATMGADMLVSRIVSEIRQVSRDPQCTSTPSATIASHKVPCAAAVSPPVRTRESQQESVSPSSSSSTVELMVHPGYALMAGEGGCGQGPDDFAQSADRDHEVSVLCDAELRRQLCDDLQVQLVRWSQLSVTQATMADADPVTAAT
eukprot:scpid48560/ scgid13132/ UPF0249 protein ydjC homolog